MTTAASVDTQMQILVAAEAVLCQSGFPNTSTRAVADLAGVSLSQIHYHFGSKQGLMLAVLRRQNTKLIARQERMYGEDAPLWRQWNQACDFYEEDLESGYVAVLQQMIAAGWSDPEIGTEVRSLLDGWIRLLRGVAERAERTFGEFGPLDSDDVASLVAAAWLGAESMQLLGMHEHGVDTRVALRRVGELIRRAEEGAGPKHVTT